MSLLFRRKPLALLVCYGFTGTLAGFFALDAHAQTSGTAVLRVDPVLLGLPPVSPVSPVTPAVPPAPVVEKAAAEVRPVTPAVVEPQAIEQVAPAKPPASAAPAAKASPASSPASIPARTVAPVVPAPLPAAVEPVRVPTPAEAASPVVAAPARTQRDEAAQQAPVPAVTSSQTVAKPVAPAPVVIAAPTPAPVVAPAAAPATGQVNSLGALRVDPALLGAPPVVAAIPLARPSDSASRAGAGETVASSVATYAPGVATTSGSGERAGTLAAGSGFALPPQVPPTGPRDHEEVPNDLTPAMALRLAPGMVPPPSKSEVPRPAFLSAQRMSGTTDLEAIAEGAAELRKIGTVVDADKMTYWPIDDELEAVGNVRLAQGNDLISGPKMRLKLEDQVGFFEQPNYFIRRDSAVIADKRWGAAQAGSIPLRKTTEGRGEAERIDFEGVNQIRMKSATYTTCKPGNDDWYAKAGDLKLDYDREEANGSDATVYFKGVPILYSPWMSFSLNNNRKSGFLSPTFGSTSNSGIELTLPYYWNIAPNMDATIAPRVLSKRGVQVGSEFNYLGETYSGQARAELLQNDKMSNRDRYGVSLRHSQNLGYGFAGAINYNQVSDDKYFTDLSSRITNTSQTQLLQQGSLSYGGGGWWSATANVQTYQTLQPDPKNPVTEPYRLKPQLTINARQPDLYRTDSSFFGQFTSFTNPTLTLPEARRTVMYPQIALPFQTPGWYVTPKIGVHSTTYSFDRQAAGTPSSLNRTLPVASLDAGMTFERPSNFFGRDYTQTLEPRLFYLNIPYKDQSRIPVFDSGLSDFNFAQIFSENQFSGHDRINDANQLTTAVTSRLIDPATGNEMIRAMIGQRFYFSNQQVSLPGQNNRVWSRSDFLTAFSGQVLPKVYADVATQYNTIRGDMERMTVGGRYVPEPGKVLNMAYRFNSATPVKQVDVSGQWPIYGGLHAVGRVNYSIQDKAPIENIAGLEYNGGCWVVRVVGQRLATSTGTASTALFLQLELNDFSQIGSNPLDLLKRSIQGYGAVNQPTANPVFGQ